MYQISICDFVNLFTITNCFYFPQIEVMNENIERAEFILANCPACFNNFLQPICAMTCSPKQSEFLKVLELQEEESGKFGITGCVTVDIFQNIYNSL